MKRDDQASDKPDVCWIGPWRRGTGYGADAAMIILALSAEQGHAIRARDHSKEWVNLNRDRNIVTADAAVEPRGCCVQIRHSPFDLKSIADLPAEYRIWRVTFETSRIPGWWVDYANSADEVWVPSRFNQMACIDSGVCAGRVRVIPPILDFPPIADSQSNSSRQSLFNFISVFAWQLRKGWDLLLRAYFLEFNRTDDVQLTIKTRGVLDSNRESIRRNIAQLIGELGAARSTRPPLKVVIGDSTEAEMAALYSSADAFVLPSRGEGWGFPYAEAMAHGLPTIGTAWGGNLDFMNHENSFLISSDLRPIDDRALQELKGLDWAAGLFAGGRWAEPSVDHLRSLLRSVYEYRSGVAERARIARSDVRSRFTLNAIGPQYRRPVVHAVARSMHRPERPS